MHLFVVQFIIKALCAFTEASLIKTSSFRCYIFSCYFLIQLFLDIVSSEGLSIASHHYIQVQMASFQVMVNTCTQLETSAALDMPSDCTEGSCSSILVVVDNFLVLQFSLFQVQTIISSSFFLKLVKSIGLFSTLQPINCGLSIDLLLLFLEQATIIIDL